MNNQLAARIQKFAIDVIKWVDVVPKNSIGLILVKQVVRSATSAGANYRSALRGKSRLDFISKLGIAEEEADECCYWLEIIQACMPMCNPGLMKILQEAREITAILTVARKNARMNMKNEQKP
jgi:four helix bundle protein